MSASTSTPPAYTPNPSSGFRNPLPSPPLSSPNAPSRLETTSAASSFPLQTSTADRGIQPGVVGASKDDEHAVKLDIEHTIVADDPRKWSSGRKTVTLCIIAGAAMIAGLTANIYNPAVTQIEEQLHATAGEVSWTLAIFIIIQGCMPLMWSVTSEIKGRKSVYIISVSIAVVGCIVAALAKSIGELIGMRALQATGTSAVMSIGAATLADIYEPSQRGTMMGIYYAAPLMGPALGPIIGGLLTQYLSWRATFWFLVIFQSCVLLGFVFIYKDTFRKERSVTYQTVLRRVMREREMELEKERTKASKRSSMTIVAHHEKDEEEHDKSTKPNSNSKVEPAVVQNARDLDLEKGEEESAPSPVEKPAMKEISLSIRDVNPFPPFWLTLRRLNNLVVLFASGLIFGFSYCIAYTCALTLEDKYGYNALDTGLVLLSFGIGSITGSVLGGRWSDRVLRRLKAARGGQIPPECRLESTKPAMLVLPLSVIAYGWLAHFHIHVASLCVALFFAGFSSIWIYSSTLSYIVDANVGRSASAVATNSTFRGIAAFLFSEVAVPLLNAIGDGGLYSLWTGLLIFAQLLILLVLYKGGAWRERAVAREERKAEAFTPRRS